MVTPASGGYEPHGVDVLRTYGEGFAGREAELEALDRAWNEGTRVFVLHAEGGAGKTRVVAKWLNQVRDDGWRGAGRVFVHSFYSQGSDERRNASSELFFEQALEHFGHTGPRLTDPTEQGRTLAHLLVEQHGLLVLDGLEPLQHPPSFDQGRLKDPAIYSLLRSLAAGRVGESSGSGLCVVTSRQHVVEFQDKIGRLVVQQPLDRLDAVAGVALLRQLEVRGPERELRDAVEDARGHAYSLMLLGSYLRDATDDHEIRRRHEIPLLKEDEEHRYHARHLFGAYVRHLGESSPEVAVLRLLGFFDRPAEEELLAVLRTAADNELNALTASLRALSSAEWNRVLRRLIILRLIDVSVSPSPPIDSHPLLREYFAEQVRTCLAEAWRTGHGRLFKYLCNRTPEYELHTLTGLQPLYQAVVHGCLAGSHQQACDIYRRRILRGDAFYSTFILGAIGADLGAVACFFTTPWTVLGPNLAPEDQAWLLHDAAYSLRALGRPIEAVEPMRVSMEIDVEREEWEGAAISASNLSELELTRGDVAAAVIAGEQSVTYADRSGREFQQKARRAALADVLHQAGRRENARLLFEDAESRQAAAQPEYPQLYSVRGFQYCDLLLSDAECAAWKLYLKGKPGPMYLFIARYTQIKAFLREQRVRISWHLSHRKIVVKRLSPQTGLLPRKPPTSQKWSEGAASETFMRPIAICEAVIKRATHTIQIAKRNHWLLDIALDHLTLARARLYKALLEVSREWRSAAEHFTAAVDGLRAANAMHHLPQALLTRAWLRYLSGDEPSCRDDLDEAWEIAERGPMPLFQTDIQLYRARLFRDHAALAEARHLIEKHGYHRRDEELADAEEAARGWEETKPSQTNGSLRVRPELKSTEGAMRDQVFISYSHRDKKLMEDLLLHLKPYLRSGSVTAWSDQQIASGAQWFQEIQAALDKTRVAVLLVSSDFLASDFIHEHELGPLLKEAKAGGVRILWIPLRAAAYKETPLKDYQAVSPPDKPLAGMSKADRDAGPHL